MRYARLITFKDLAPAEPIPFEPGQRQPDQRRDAPMPQAQAVAAAQTGARESRPDEPSAGESFYALAGEAVKKIGAPVVNDIVKKINQHGYAWGVQELQAQMAA